VLRFNLEYPSMNAPKLTPVFGLAIATIVAIVLCLVRDDLPNHIGVVSIGFALLLTMGAGTTVPALVKQLWRNR
jgi:hypothetical protein